MSEPRSASMRLTVFAGLVRKELQALRRDALGLAALFVMPLVFIVLMTLALQDSFSPPRLPARYAVLDADGQAAARELARRWAAAHGAASGLPADWRAALRGGTLDYVLEIERGFSARVTALDEPGEVTQASAAAPPARARLWLEPSANTAVLQVADAALERSVGQLRARLLMLQLSGLPAPRDPSVAGFAQAAWLERAERPSAVQQNVPAWLVFGMFFVVATLGSLFVEERRNGTLARLTTLGVGPGMMLATKGVTYLGVNVVQAVVMLAAGLWLMPLLGAGGLSLAGTDAFALAAVVLATSAAAVGLGLALATLFRTSAQAQVVGPFANVLMGALGGVMVPTFVMPATMQKVAALSPMNWALEAWLGVLLRAATLPQLLPQLALLLGLAVLAVLVAAFTLRRGVAA